MLFASFYSLKLLVVMINGVRVNSQYCIFTLTPFIWFVPYFALGFVGRPTSQYRLKYLDIDDAVGIDVMWITIEDNYVG